jgi:hypothetical protein
MRGQSSAAALLERLDPEPPVHWRVVEAPDAMAAEAAAAREFRLTGQQREPSLCGSSDDCVMRLKRRPTAVFASPRRQGRLDDHR